MGDKAKSKNMPHHSSKTLTIRIVLLGMQTAVLWAARVALSLLMAKWRWGRLRVMLVHLLSPLSSLD